MDVACSGDMSPASESYSSAPVSFPHEVCAQEVCAPAVEVTSPHEGWMNGPVPGKEILDQHDTMPPGDYMRALSRYMGRPVLVVDPAALPFADHIGTFSKEQLKARAAELKRIVETELSHPIWKKWNFIYAAAYRDANCGVWNTDMPLENRQAAMQSQFGDVGWKWWHSAAIVTLPAKSKNVERDWRELIGLLDPPRKDHPNGRWDRAERLPKADPGRYRLKHEFGHVQQWQPTDALADTPGCDWLHELGADFFALKGLLDAANDPTIGLEKAAQNREIVEGVRHMRAIQSFLKYPTRYCMPVALDDAMEGKITFTKEYVQDCTRHFEESWLAAKELRLRVTAYIENWDIPKDSASLQAILRDWNLEADYRDEANKICKSIKGNRAKALPMSMPETATKLPEGRIPVDEAAYKLINDLLGDPFDWGGYDPATTLPVLAMLVQSGEIDSPLARRTAELVLKAADYFCPSILKDYQIVKAPLRSEVPTACGQSIPAYMAYQQINRERPDYVVA